MMTPPKADKRPYPMTRHGDTRVDDYYWLRDDERTDADVLNYLQAENAFTAAVLKPQQQLRETLYQEMVGRIPPQEESVPYVRNGYRYQTRFEPGNEYAIYVRQPVSTDSDWETLLDGNQRAEGHEFYTLGGLDVSPDNQLLAVAEDYLSRRQYDIRIKTYPVGAGTMKLSVIRQADLSGQMIQKRCITYENMKTLLPYQVYRHVVGTDPEQDKLIYQESDDTFMSAWKNHV